MSKTLVVGGAGYIGGLLTDLLIEKGLNPTVYDNLLYEPRFLKDCNFIYGDVRDTNLLLSLEKDFERIIWLAAIVGDGACSQNPELTIEINVNALQRFLKKAKRRIIYTSTCSVYGAQDKILTEESITNPLSLYASTKLESEKHVLENNGLVFRLGTLFGLGDKYSRIRLDLVVNVLTLKALTEKKLTVFGGNQWRPIIAVRDVAQYLVEGSMSDHSGIFNLKKENVKILDLAKRIQKIFPGVDLNTTKINFEDTRNYRVDSSKISKQFRFKPVTTVEKEVRKMKKLFAEKRIKNVNDNIYYNTQYVKSLLENKKI